jgi:ABC-2 type transport system ATP-binding protein
MRRTVTGNGSILKIESLNRRFGEHEVVRSLDLAVAPGERVAMGGPNGSGKTTVLRCIAGTLTPTSGRIEVGGYTAGAIEARRLVGASLSQERSFYLRMSGYANLIFFARLRFDSEREAAKRVGELVEELQIGDIASERADRCSSGMIQQLALARALLGGPLLLLLDEPTRSLDVDARARFWGALERRPEAAVLLATHLDEDLQHCGRTISLPA